MRLSAVLIVLTASIACAQGPAVPSRMEFGGIVLKLNEGAQREIQSLVDELMRSPSYFNAKAEEAQLFFPIIERIFKEEGVPEDFKYLIIQESNLVADAVSVSNAVGYWQFKDFTAAEMGLRVDKHIDERMNIVASTYGAARYIKRNNFYFNNWIYALQAYQMGAGGVQRAEDTRYFGARSMPITKKTYWYVMKFLAHKVAYGHAMQNLPAPEQSLVEFSRGGGKDFKDLSRELMVSEDVIRTYNKWLRKGTIPTDKVYPVVFPAAGDPPKQETVVFHDEPDIVIPAPDPSPAYEGIEQPDAFPKIREGGLFASGTVVNGIPGFVYTEEIDLQEKLRSSKVSESDFRKFNEILPHEQLHVGQVYYLKRKRGKAKAHYHTVQHDETLWMVSQKYGVRTSKLLKKNRISSEAQVEPGLVLWLRYIRPADEEAVVKQLSKPALVSQPALNAPKFADNTHSTKMEERMLAGPDEKEIIHVVKEKETFYSIASLYKVEVMDLTSTNGMHVSDALHVGQVLKILVPADYEPELELQSTTKLPSEGQVYTVKPGDTLYSIAKQFDMTIDELMLLNNRNTSHLSVGEELIVK